MTRRSTRYMSLGAAGLLALAGAVPVAAQDTVSIEMIGAGYTDQMQPYYDDLAARFMEQNQDIDVSVQVVSWNDIYTVLNTRVASGDPPDIMNLNYFANFAADDLLYTAEEIVTPEVLEDIIQVFRDNSKYEGVEYAVPDLASDRLFFYNEDILAAAGVEPPSTWSEVKAVCQAILDTQPGIVPLALPLGPEEAQAEFFIWAGGNDGGYFRDGEWIIDSPENLETLEFLQELVDMGCTQPNPGSFNRTDGAFALFAQGVAAMLNGAIFLPGELENTYESDVNWGVVPFPAADGKESITLGVQDYFFGFKKEGNQEAIQRFLSFLFQPDNYAAFLDAAGGFLPATISAGEQMASDPALAPFIEVLPTAIFYPSDQASWPAVQAAVQEDIGTVFTGADKQEVLDQIQAVAESE
ncbi:MAG TPA: extracellular solute-binding protein [Anaerolineae bacterium]|nr:extracellular solute-binding protein [Anaerolineae bacterium]